MAAASLWLLIRWLDSGKWLDGILFLAAGALLWRVHLVYWPFYFVYAIYFLARSDRKASWVQAVTIAAGLVLALLPVATSRAGDEPGRRAARVRAAAFLVRDWGNSFKIRLVAGVRARGFDLRTLAARAPRVDSVAAFSAIALIAGWWLVQPVGLFAYSHLSGVSVFTTRYVSIALPGAALAATAAAAFFIPKSIWQPLALVMGIAALDLRRAVERTLAAASQFGLARSCPSRERAGACDRPRRCWSSAHSSKRSRRSGARITRCRGICIAGWTCIQSTASPICFPMAIRPRGSSMPRLSRRARFRLPGDS